MTTGGQQGDGPSWMQRVAEHGTRHARRVVVAVIGGTVLLLGIIMVVTPGPAFIVIPAGLAILATEFVWARRLLSRAKKFIEQSKAASDAK